MGYNQNYHSEIQKTALMSSRVMITYLKKTFNPNSVIDVGCGRGTWLTEWQNQGVHDYLGVDGGGQDVNMLLIPEDKFIEFNLNNPLKLNRKFDIVTCFEVVEHLKPSSADIIIESLTTLSDIIVFSAAVPRQGGFKHINEKWPKYWASKFKKFGFVFIDGIRWHLMPHEEVSWWYRQNTFLVIKEELYLAKYSHLPLYSPDFYLVHKNIFRTYTNLFYYLSFRLEQFIYNNFHSFYHFLAPFVKKTLKKV